MTNATALELLDAAGRDRLAAWESEIRSDPARIRARFPAAAREVGRTPGGPGRPGEDRLEDAVRARLLDAAAVGLTEPRAVAAEMHDLYRYGDADERRAVLLGLHRLGVGDTCADLVHDALRTNDPRLVAAALGPYGASVLDDASWRQGVLKCLFTGVPLDLVSGLTDRADDRLAAMVAAYVDERTAAGRDVPPDAHRVMTARTSRET